MSIYKDIKTGLEQAIAYERGETVETDVSKLSIKEFIEKYCHNCGSQRCEGIGTEWFDGCKFKDRLSKEK